MDEDEGTYGGIRCQHCDGFIDYDYLDMCDEKTGGYVICPHCGEEV